MPGGAEDRGFMKFKIETHDDFLERLTREVERGDLRDLVISTMNLFARPESRIFRLLAAMRQSNIERWTDFQVMYDRRYAKRFVALADGHYVFRRSFWDPEKWFSKIEPARVSKQTLREFSDIIVNLPPRHYQTRKKTGFWRKLLSWHLLQIFAASHVKAAASRDKKGRVAATVMTGELSSESRQNNLALTLWDAPDAADFIKIILEPTSEIGPLTYAVEKITDKMSLIADYGNYGNPWQISEIHKQAEMMINPAVSPEFKRGKPEDVRPVNVLLISQYVPSGRILRALNTAAKPKSEGGLGARVIVPLEPADDYRRRDIGFRILFNLFEKHRSKFVRTPTRPVPSHVKCLIVKYTDGSLSMNFGSDNFDSTSDSFYRNTELAVQISRVRRGETGFRIIQAMLDKLVEGREISAEERRRFDVK
jgi:hypothetical protein